MDNTEPLIIHSNLKKYKSRNIDYVQAFYQTYLGGNEHCFVEIPQSYHKLDHSIDPNEYCLNFLKTLMVSFLKSTIIHSHVF